MELTNFYQETEVTDPIDPIRDQALNKIAAKAINLSRTTVTPVHLDLLF